MTRHRHLIALIASYWLMGAIITMFISLADVIASSTAIRAIDKDLFTGFQ